MRPFLASLSSLQQVITLNSFRITYSYRTTQLLFPLVFTFLVNLPVYNFFRFSLTSSPSLFLVKHSSHRTGFVTHSRSFSLTYKRRMSSFSDTASIPGTVARDDYKLIRIGVTGSIGMGKSTVTNQFRRLGFPVFDADEIVHRLYSENGDAVEPIRAAFPTAINTENNSVNRNELMKLVMSNVSVLHEIERIVHPLVRQKRAEFTTEAKSNHYLIVVYDIPLFFEKHNDYAKDVDYVIVVSCDENTQRERVLKRPNMTIEKYQAIFAKQLSDDYKRSHADYVIYTNYPGYVEGKAQLATILEDVLERKEKEAFLQWKSYRGVVGPPLASSVSLTSPPQSNTSSITNITDLFDAIIFDLDETLCATLQPIEEGWKNLFTVMEKKMPHTFAKFNNNQQEIMNYIKTEMLNLRSQNPLIGHDFTELRKRVLFNLAKDNNEHDHDAVEECMKVRFFLGSFRLFLLLLPHCLRVPFVGLFERKKSSWSLSL
jgi:dephospho-CoA kinase